MAGGDGFERGLEIGVGVHAVHLGRFNQLTQVYRAPWKGAVSQRVRSPSGNCRSSRKQSERITEVTTWFEALRWKRAALGGSASMRAATRVKAEQASERVMRKSTRR